MADALLALPTRWPTSTFSCGPNSASPDPGRGFACSAGARMINKLVNADALADVRDGLGFGGFGRSVSRLSHRGVDRARPPVHRRQQQRRHRARGLAWLLELAAQDHLQFSRNLPRPRAATLEDPTAARSSWSSSRKARWPNACSRRGHSGVLHTDDRRTKLAENGAAPVRRREYDGALAARGCC